MTMQQRIIIIAGPTGAGKTAAAIGLCVAHGGAVINFDSRQVYEDFPVITAQPSEEERAQCPHSLYGFLPCSEKMTAGRFVELAEEEIARVAVQGMLPVLVGGTGLYMRSLLEGLAPIPRIPENVARALGEDLDLRGQEHMFRRLQAIDPEYAGRIHPNDTQRTLRALEVYEATGERFSWWHGRPVPPPRYDAVKIGIRMEGDALRARLGKRIDAMLAMGAEEEARRAWERCPDASAPGWSGIGCAEMLRYVRGELGLDETRELWLRNTRRYAKRQMTWFRKDRDIRWFESGDVDGVLGAL